MQLIVYYAACWDLNMVVTSIQVLFHQIILLPYGIIFLPSIPSVMSVMAKQSIHNSQYTPPTPDEIFRYYH